jgi:hypothetical protein
MWFAWVTSLEFVWRVVVDINTFGQLAPSDQVISVRIAKVLVREVKNEKWRTLVREERETLALG